MVERFSTEFRSPLSQLDLGATDHATGLAIIGRTLLRQLLLPRHIAFQRMVLAASNQFPDLMGKWYQVGPRRSQAFIARFLGDPETMAAPAIFFHDMIVTDPVNRALMGQPPAWTDVEARVEKTAALLVGGLEPLRS